MSDKAVIGVREVEIVWLYVHKSRRLRQQEAVLVSRVSLPFYFALQARGVWHSLWLGVTIDNNRGGGVMISKLKNPLRFFVRCEYIETEGIILPSFALEGYRP